MPVTIDPVIYPAVDPIDPAVPVIVAVNADDALAQAVELVKQSGKQLTWRFVPSGDAALYAEAVAVGAPLTIAEAEL